LTQAGCALLAHGEESMECVCNLDAKRLTQYWRMVSLPKDGLSKEAQNETDDVVLNRLWCPARQINRLS